MNAIVNITSIKRPTGGCLDANHEEAGGGGREGSVTPPSGHVARFWRKVEKTATCWLWTAAMDRDGYGAFASVTERGVRRILRASRVAWELCHGPIPKGLWVLHRCDVRSCVNPAHLFLGTQFDNMRDASAKGRLQQQVRSVGAR